MDNKQIIISAQNIAIGYTKGNTKPLFENLSFELYKGELVCLLGINGAGKSTLLRTISNSQPSLSGKILFRGKDISTYSERSLSKLLGLVLTDKTSVGGLLVKELVELGRYPYTGFFGQLNKEDREIINKAMTDVGISHKADAYVAELSDGERQKAMIAKALAQQSPIILLDEPTAFLDIESRIEIINLLHNLASTQGKTILLSTHDIDLALLLADRLWLLSKENGLVCGGTEDLVLTGKLDNFFQGKNVVFDRNTGSFLPKRQSHSKVYLDAADDIYFWVKNIIEKNSLAVTTDRDENIISIHVDEKNIRVELKGEPTPLLFSNFLQLSDYLKHLSSLPGHIYTQEDK